MTTADLGTVQVTISGKDVGLGQVMREASQAMQQAAQSSQVLTQSLTKQEAADERAKAASLAYISAIVKQRGAAEQLDNAMGLLTKNADQFATETITGAKYSALYQTTLQASRQSALDLALANAKLFIGTEQFIEALEDVAVEVNNVDNTEKQYLSTVNRAIELEKQHNALLDKRAREEEKARQKIQQNAIATLQKAQADARALAAAKKHGSAITLLEDSLDQLKTSYGEVITRTIQWSNAQAQLARYQKQTDSDSRRLNGTLFSLVKGLNSYVGAAYALNAVFTNIGAVITAGNELEKITSTVKALSKSQSRFNEIMAAARQQQELYGGSLQENLDDLSGFIYISNQTGIAVDRLANTARRLAIIDPAQGMKGASVALKEFFSGDIQSLSRRFEISRTSLNSIKNLGTEIERLQGLDALLEDMGIGMQILDQKTQLTATTYDKLAGSFMDATAAVGQLAANILKVPAQKTTDIFSAITGAFQADLKQRIKEQEGLTKTNKQVFQATIESGKAISYYRDEITLTAQYARTSLYSFEIYTEAQLDMANSIVQSGSSAREAVEYVTKYGTIINDVAANTENLNNVDLKHIKNAGVLRQWLVEKIAKYENIRGPILNYAAAISNGTVETDKAIAAINILISTEIQRQNSLITQTAAVQTATEILKMYIEENKLLTSEQINATAQSGLMSASQEAIAAYAQMAADGLLTTAEASAILGAQFGVTTVDANILIGALEKIRNWRGNTQITAMLAKGTIGTGDLLQVSQTFQDLGIDADYQDIADALKNYGVESARAAEAQAKATEDAVKAQNEYEFSLLNTADKIASLNTKLQGLTTSNKEYWSTLSKIKQLEEQLAREREGTGGGGSTATQEEQVTELEKLLYELSDIRTEFYSDMEDAEKEYQQNVLDIQKEFARKQKEAEQANERDKRRSRASFYQSLTDVEGIDVTSFSAQYEQIFLEAQRIAQEGKAALSKEFLDLRQDQLNEMIDLEKEMADIRTDEDLPETTKQAKLEYLQGIKKLIEDAQAEELKQLIEGGDKNQAELADQLAEEAKQYGDQTQKIAQAAKDQADAKITAAERSKKIIGEETELLQKQLDIYYDMYRLLGRETANKIVGITTESVPLALAPGAPTAPTAAEYTVPELKIDTPSVIIQAPQPSAIAPSNATPTAATSMQALSEVHDRVLTATLQTIGARLESKLSEVIAAVYDSAGTTVDAISRIRIPAPQIVSR